MDEPMKPDSPGPEPRTASELRVRVVDVSIPFGSMVALVFKWTLASIPALLLLMLLAGIVGAFVTSLIGGVGTLRGIGI